MQPVDVTTLTAICHDLRCQWIPARCEQVYQRDRTTVSLALRTLTDRGWLTLSWHPQAARLHLDHAPPRQPDTFTFSQQLKHQLGGFALVTIETIAPWERVLDLQFARRPGDPVQWHLYVEVMGKYSNVILTNAHNQIVTAAHQVSEQQSRVRPILTGDAYQPPPPITAALPHQDESQARWQERVALVPGPLKRRLMQAYGGLSSALTQSMLTTAGLGPDLRTDQLTQAQWTALYQTWQAWLCRLATSDFQPGWTEDGYTVLGWGLIRPAASVQTLLRDYYSDQLNRQAFERLRHQLSQLLSHRLQKLRQKEATFLTRLDQSEQADQTRQWADLLMAYGHQWQPGLTHITLPDFETAEPVTIPLIPEKTAVQNAQALYRQHQKLKRARQAVKPLLAEVWAETAYLEQVEATLMQVSAYKTVADLDAIAEIRDELAQQGYLPTDQRIRQNRHQDAFPFHRYISPSGCDILIGRNNRQNDQLTFGIATDYDLWFHSQEIPGSHLLLRLAPGQAPSDADLQYAANLAAYFSRARQADQVPVIYTQLKHVYKPKGARPGMVIYTHETVLWGYPQAIQSPLPPHPEATDSVSQ
ncbi:hypothetical protein XM38_005570 [Halomicronema hongdechloris C2206]|uniref:Rqc2 homolog RqcH n=1 Tax=Halomicronema hongdechloris C2206 TaxID=1641165 RepID=A0A1Z3HH30_9CYAN|nr:NFACT RNA binding domain-containing protein [Halomicronema hongdechloris]ASC69629.1 hypothetical protein XM38_005570 [Halomicronema hongdechloris C2206]